MRTKRPLLLPLWAGLLIFSSLAPLRAQVNVRTEELSVHVDDGLITLAARNVPVQDVLQAIAKQSGLRIVQDVDLERQFSLSIERQPLPEVLRQIFASESYQLYRAQAHSEEDNFTGPDTDVLWIFPDGSSLAPAATLYFEALLFEGNVRERKEAIKGLRKLGTTDAIESISFALGDQDAGVRELAFDVLADIGGDDALAAIASASLDEDAWIRGESANALAGSDSESAVQHLSLALKDPNPDVRMFVVEAISDIPSEQSVVVLRLALRDRNPRVRMEAVDALEQIGGDEALQALMRATGDDDPEVQDAVSDALLLLDPRNE